MSQRVRVYEFQKGQTRDWEELAVFLARVFEESTNFSSWVNDTISVFD